MASALRQLTRDEVAKHANADDLWVIIDAKVYDLTRFKKFHPGGAHALLESDVAGQDATEAFYGLHRHEVLLQPHYAKLQIGVLEDEKPAIYGRTVGELSDVPYAEPTWLSEGYHSPYFTESHRRFQKAMRKFVDEVVYPDALAREEDGKPPSKHVIDKMAEMEITVMRMGPGKHLKGRTLMGGVVTPKSSTTSMMSLVLSQELMRMNMRGYGDAMQTGALIGLPPLLNFGAPALQARLVPDILAGRTFICLAVTEAFAGSDVSGIRTTATKTPDGRFWVVNGTKKWITNATFSDYFTTICKTGDSYTVIVVERTEGVETKPIKTSYSPTAGTGFVTFDNVLVPVENTLGKEGQGMFVILSNFNHERWTLIAASARAQRMIVEECLKWTAQRKVFGRPLSSQAVVRAKLAGMIARAEAVQSWLENLTYQMCNMSYKEQSVRLAGQLGFLKMFSTRSAQETAQDAVQIFGGRALTKTGMGKFIEHYHRTVPFDAVLGGAEDVIGDLGVRQAMKAMPKNARL